MPCISHKSNYGTRDLVSGAQPLAQRAQGTTDLVRDASMEAVSGREPGFQPHEPGSQPQTAVGGTLGAVGGR